GGGGHRARDRASPRGGARARDHPPRREARERPPPPGRDGEAHRLRHRARHRRPSLHGDGADPREPRAHGPRADRAWGVRREERPLLPRDGALFPAHRAPPLRGQKPPPGPPARGGWAIRRPTEVGLGDPGPAPPHPYAAPREGSRSPLSE